MPVYISTIRKQFRQILLDTMSITMQTIGAVSSCSELVQRQISECRTIYPRGGVLELTRVALNGKQEHTSQAVAMALKALHKDVPQCRLVISYADCDQDHLGTIYQATNWIYEGLSKGDTYFIVHGRKTHRKSIAAKRVVIDGKKMHCPSTLPMVQRFFDPNATVFHSTGKRKYLFPMDKRMRKQILPLATEYPKKDDNWTKIDRNTFKQK